jgi:hypothetical protein
MVSTVFEAELNGNVYDLGKTTLMKVRDQESNGE